MPVKYKVNTRKTLEALVWIASRRPGTGFHFILKVLFYADKFHLQKFGRPILGDTYVKMTHGPVASMAYDILKKDSFLPAPLLKEICLALDIRRDEMEIPEVVSKREPCLDIFSGTDLEAMEEAFTYCDGLSFPDLSDISHQERAWTEARMNGEMDYELFVDEDLEGREDMLEYIHESSQYLAL